MRALLAAAGGLSGPAHAEDAQAGQPISPIPGFTVEGNAVDGYTFYNQRYEKCLDADANRGGNGTVVQIWDCNGTTQQRWLYISQPLAKSVVNVRFNRCLDVDANGTGGNGNKVQLWDCNQRPQQDWFVVAGLFWHNTWAHGRCLDADTNNLGLNGTKVQVWDCNGEGQQQWFAS